MTDEQRPAEPRTPLGKRLMAIRERIVQSGTELLDWDLIAGQLITDRPNESDIEWAKQQMAERESHDNAPLSEIVRQPATKREETLANALISALGDALELAMDEQLAEGGE